MNLDFQRVVKSVNLNNNTANPLQVLANFDSGSEQTYDIAAGGSVVVERDINEESYTYFDPVKNISVVGRNSILGFDPDGIKIYTYNINEIDGELSFEQTA